MANRRRYSDAQLRQVIAASHSWRDAAATVRRRAALLKLDISSVEVHRPNNPGPALANLSRSGSLIAAAWYSMCGQDVSWPLEPCRYDLIVSDRGAARRIQVKTTTSVTERGVWHVNVSTTGPRGRRVYTPDEVDDFFVVDGAMNFYVIPLSEMPGMHVISLSAYQQYRVRSGEGQSQAH